MNLAGGHPDAVKSSSHPEPQQSTEEKRSELLITVMSHPHTRNPITVRISVDHNGLFPTISRTHNDTVSQLFLANRSPTPASDRLRTSNAERR